MTTNQEFIKKIYKVFSYAEKPSITEITPHRCEECDEIRDSFYAYDQKSIPDNLIKKFFDSLPLLSPKALKYYLPRFLEFSLLNRDELVFEFCLYHLTGGKPNDPYWEDRIKIFNQKEKELLKEYSMLCKQLSKDFPIDGATLERALQFWS